MTLLDATALIGFVAGEPSKREVRRILRSGSAAIVATNLAETLDRLARVLGLDLQKAEDTLVTLLATVLSVIPIGEAEARRGAHMRVRHYHRQRAPLSLADCLLLAAAAISGARIATSDAVLATAARAEGIEVIALANSNGDRP